MILVQIHKKFYTVPQSWNELSSKQLLACVKVLYSQKQMLDAQVTLFKILTGASWWRLCLAGPLDIEDKLYLTDFLFEENNLTKNLLPSYPFLYGPADDFNNLLVQEFIFSEMYYERHKDSKLLHSSDLNMLIATLYRPAKWFYNKKINRSGDVRKKYNDNLTARYAKVIAKWPLSIKLGILHWYEGCRLKLIKDNPDVFGASGGTAAKYGLWSIMRGIAEKGIHGTINLVENMFVKVFMMELNEVVEEAARIPKPKPHTT